MKIVVALGGHAILQQGQDPTIEAQRANVRVAARALAPLVPEHQLVVTHGNGPQVGELARRAALEGDRTESLDVVGAQTEGMIGYLIEQEMGNLLPFPQPFATILTMVEVDLDDPAFTDPDKPIGPAVSREEADRLAERHGWTFKPAGEGFRRVVPSPEPLRVFEVRPIDWLLEMGTVVICAGGGGIPTAYDAEGTLVGADVVVDKDRASGLLARQLDADLLVLATDVAGVFADWGTPRARLIDELDPASLRELELPSGSMGPKVDAACSFVEATGRRAAIGSLAEISGLVAGNAGTQVRPTPASLA